MSESPYTVRTFVAFFTSLASLWVILARISAQVASPPLPELLAWAVGFFMTTPLCFLGIPSLLCAVAGISGDLGSVPYLIFSVFLSFWPTGSLPFHLKIFKFGRKAVGTLWKYFVLPLPFSSDESSTFFQWLLFREPCKYYPPDTKKEDNKYPDEMWIYINGVATTKAIADANRKLLFKMFGRPIHLVHNPSDTILVDLLECVAGKTGLLEWFDIAPRKKLKEVLRSELENAEENAKAGHSGIKKIVLIAHSQGTIITGNALTELGKESAEMKKSMQTFLEVYNFADCAHQMPAENVKYLENISNGGDLVAYLGHLFPDDLKPFWLDKDGKGIKITGESIIEPSLWGHLLNSHYLFPMLKGYYAESKLARDYINRR